jgi:hypothetical protein
VGTVRDASGAVIPDAHVVATGHTGGYVFTDIPIGNYAVSFTAKGFQEMKVEKSEIHIATAVRQHAMLQVQTAFFGMRIFLSTSS